MNVIDVRCDSCQTAFSVPKSMRGGIANCPNCRRSVRIQSGPELFYWALVGGSVFGVVTVSALITLASPIAASVSLVIGLGLVALVAAAA
jgi:uncharacterized paraquat-inducible protein A